VVNRSRISGARKKALSGLEGLLEIVGLGMMTKSVWTGTHSKSWRERVPDFRSCNAKAADTEWSANKRKREDTGI